MKKLFILLLILSLSPLSAFAAPTTVSNGGTATSSFQYGLIGSIGGLNFLRNFATSTLYGTGVGGQVLAWLNGVPTWTATSSINNGVSSITLPQGVFTGGLTFATTSNTTNGITSKLMIIGSGQTLTFSSDQTGTLTVPGGGTGQSTFTSSQLLYGNGTAALSSVGTTTFTPSAAFSVTGTIGAFVGGANSTLDLANNGVALTKLATIAGNTVLGNNTGATGNVVAFATSTLFGPGTNGFVLAQVNGTPQWVATSSIQNFSIGPTGALQIGPAVTLATSSTAFNGLTASTTITATGNVITFANTLAGLFQVGGGGTGLSSVADGRLIMGGQTATALTSIATTSGAGRFLSQDYTTGRPAWIATSSLGVALSDTTGILPETRGGTNQSSYTTGDILYASNTNTLSKRAIGTGGFVLAVVNGVPAWVATSSINNGVTSITLPQGAFSGALTFATSSNTTNGLTSSLTIVGSGSTLTFNPSLTGVHTVAGGGTGQSTFTASQLLYGNGTAALSSVGTTTFTPSAAFTVGGTIGAFVGGANSTLDLANNGVALTKLATIAANTVLGNATGATGNVTAIATSTLFGPGTNGFVLSMQNGTPQWVATSSIQNFSIGPTGALQVGPAVTLATTSTAYNGLTASTTITASGNIINFANTLSGVLGTGAGGTASTTPLGGILVGNGTAAIKSLVIGTNLTFDGTTLNASGGGGTNTDKWATSTIPDALGIYPNSATKVAVGSTTPFYKFQVVDSSQPGGVTGGSPAAQIAVSTTTNLNARVNVLELLAISNGAFTDGFGAALTFRNSASGFYGPSTAQGIIQSVSEISGSSAGLAFSTNVIGTIGERMRINGSGLVAIGTTSPASLFEMSGTANTVTPLFVSGVTASLTNRNTTDNTFSALAYRAVDANGVGTTSSMIQGITTTHAGSGISGDIAFVTNTLGTMTEKARLDAAGDFGIGTTTPQKLLHVYGNQAGGVARIERRTAGVASSKFGTYDVAFSNTGADTDLTGPSQTFSYISSAGVVNTIGDISAARSTANNTGNITLSSYSAGSVKTTLTVDGPSGITSIASTSPSSSLCGTFSLCHYDSVAASFVQISGVNSDTKSIFQTVAATSLNVGTVTAHPLQFFTANTMKMNILTNGNVGIGTTTPWATESIASSTYNGNIGVPVWAAATSTTLLGELASIFGTTTLSTNTGGLQRFDSGVRFKIGNNTVTYDQLAVNGRISSTWQNSGCDMFTMVPTATADTLICNQIWFDEGTDASITSITAGSTLNTRGARITVTSGTTADNGSLRAGPTLSTSYLATSSPVIDVAIGPLTTVSTTTGAIIGWADSATVPTAGCIVSATTTATYQALCLNGAGGVTQINTGFATSSEFTRIRAEFNNTSFVVYGKTSPQAAIVKVATITTNIPTSATLTPFAGPVRRTGGTAIAPVMDIWGIRYNFRSDWYMQ